jgi:hypothetical protein
VLSGTYPESESVCFEIAGESLSGLPLRKRGTEGDLTPDRKIAIFSVEHDSKH